MSHFTYENCPYPVRESMVEAFRASWLYIAEPGSWWTGEERVAIAAAARDAADCLLCAKRKTALSPAAVSGAHLARPESSRLSAKVVDSVHRIATDASRLSGTWLGDTLDATFTDGHWVEAVSVVVTIVCIDAQHKSLGLPLEPLPESLAGDPDGYRPPNAQIDVGWVPMLTPDALTGPEADIYGGSPQMGNVIRAMSLVPDAVRQLDAQASVQYLPNVDVRDFGKTGELSLSRPQIELVAGRTSALNDCFY
ncbi:MAG: alkylhydroperoxidase-related (seleno)protein [Pseudomonadales bacterium]|jgi:hypothetical protein|nr:alkylhydroperoxidase-related (seleno)protein [Pseudomonadales bacterium]MDP6828508.1 alkylhydroperoxidase-related (seleno)protein [Pseudomonadales bacterium]MDP6970507.1 alkylhydroperoxidase-related (seleno)protein [Pseudomonadales bacterium]|tara:strand:+ start:804 stop:1559 length:756 start_codon:yes stop_codon:yes gene_type:complete